MSSKKLIIVLGTILILPLGYVAYLDVVRTWHDLQQQENQVEYLNKQQEELDNKLNQKIEAQIKSEEEFLRLEQQKRQLESEKQKLEKELQASTDRRIV